MLATTASYDFPSRLDTVGRIGEVVRTLWKTLRFEPSRAFDIELCLVEAVTNAICHAHSWNEEKRVRIEIRCEGEMFEAAVLDEGENTEAVERSLAESECAPVLRENGRGLFLIRKLADEVELSGTPIGKVLTMRWRLE